MKVGDKFILDPEDQEAVVRLQKKRELLDFVHDRLQSTLNEMAKKYRDLEDTTWLRIAAKYGYDAAQVAAIVNMVTFEVSLEPRRSEGDDMLDRLRKAFGNSDVAVTSLADLFGDPDGISPR